MLIFYTIGLIINILIVGYYFNSLDDGPTQDELIGSALFIAMGPFAYLAAILFAVVTG